MPRPVLSLGFTGAVSSACIIAAVFAAACSANPADSANASEATGSVSSAETHPYQARLVCERAPGAVLVGQLYDISSGSKVKVVDYTSMGNVGACELAVRGARNNKVCVESGSGYTVRDLITKTNSGSYSKSEACAAITRGGTPLRTQPGYVDIMPQSEVAPFVASLPQLSDATLNSVVRDANTIWYDESSLTYVYQDSFGDPKGLRGNRVGYDVGENASEPDIHALVEYFKPEKFKFPFSIAAGADFADNVYAMNFWLPPRDGTGKVLPVRIAMNNSHWQWVFPAGTTIGEVLFMQAPDDKSWVAFEVRTRSRALDHWETNVFRPYLDAASLSRAIKAKRSAWGTTPDLAALVAHLDAPTALEAYSLEAPAYAALFPKQNGAMDFLPATTDNALVKELLRTKTFERANGAAWRVEGTQKAWAASTHASFHIVPKEYIGGMLEVSNTACRKCHEQTSRPLNNLDGRVVLYGEVWGEDEVFSWHPFTIDTDTFSVADGNRHINTRFVSAGLVVNASLTGDPTHYQALSKPYSPIYE